jgi:hypothetical protein
MTVRAIVEWFWRGAALTDARRARPGPEAARFARLSTCAAQLARRARDPLERASSDAIACELARQSVYWSLRALEAAGDRAPGAGEPARQAPSLMTVWSRADRASLRAACDAATLERFERELLDTSFAALAARAPSDLAGTTTAALTLSDALAARVEQSRTRAATLIWQRVARVGALLALPLALFAVLGLRSALNPYARDIAHGKPWRASSAYFPGCVSPSQTCNPTAGFFFHTIAEANPWLEIDLGAARSFTGARVLNRTDCCREQAVPLLLEVSDDHVKWRVVAEQTHDFTYWNASFPAVQARWVRLRVPRHSVLHLREVLVLR